MAFHIEKASVITGKTVYYTGDNRWSDDASKKKSFSTKAKATAETNVQTDSLTGPRTGAGFKGATVVSS